MKLFLASGCAKLVLTLGKKKQPLNFVRRNKIILSFKHTSDAPRKTDTDDLNSGSAINPRSSAWNCVETADVQKVSYGDGTNLQVKELSERVIRFEQITFNSRSPVITQMTASSTKLTRAMEMTASTTTLTTASEMTASSTILTTALEVSGLVELSTQKI